MSQPTGREPRYQCAICKSMLVTNESGGLLGPPVIDVLPCTSCEEMLKKNLDEPTEQRDI